MNELQCFFGGIGTSELLVIGGIIVLLFGSKRLPEVGRGIARGIQELKKGLREGDTPSDSSHESSSSQPNKKQE